MADPNPEIRGPGFYDEDQDEGRLVEAPSIQALTQLNAAEINQQIMTARAYPRDITSFRRQMRAMVTYDQPTALSCLYALKRSGKVIEGPSIRFAEAAMQAWGNARAGSRIVDIGDDFITAQGFFYDLEKNMALAFEVMRRITDSKGVRYGDDLIGVTGNAAGSIALRNAILKGVPKTAWNESYQDAREVSIGKGESITVKREQMIKAFAPMGVTKEQIFGVLGVKGVDDVSVDHMILMGGILNSIKEGEVTVEAAFAPENMINPDVVAPRRPRPSDFQRDEPDKSGKQPDPSPSVKVTVPEGVETVSVMVSKEGGSGGGGAGKPEPKHDAFADWFKDQLGDLAKAEKIRDVASLRDAVMLEVKGYPEMEKEFAAACDARSKAIMAAARAKK